MRLLIATVGLEKRGGVHSYVEAILSELTDLGHLTYVVAPEFGLREKIECRGGIACTSYDQVEGPVDGVIALVDQPALMARAAFPEVPMVFVSHGPWYGQDVPPRDAGVSAVVALSDLSCSRLGESAAVLGGARLVRLRQPAELTVPPVECRLPDRPRNAVVVAHRLESRIGPLVAALDGRGVTTDVVAGGTYSDDVLDRMAASDIVVGIGRVVVEGMAAGRACLVLGEFGGASWIEAGSYPELEASGFFLAEDVVSPGEFPDLVDRYEPDMGRFGVEVALKNHSSAGHVSGLLALIEEGVKPESMRLSPSELKEQASLRYQSYEARIAERNSRWWGAAERRQLHEEVEALARWNSDLEQELGRVSSQLESVYESVWWRATEPARRLASWIRSFLGR